MAIIGCIEDLGQAYLSSGRFGNAELLFERVLASLDTRFGSSTPSIARSRVLRNLGTVYDNQKRHEEAAALRERSVQGLPPSEEHHLTVERVPLKDTLQSNPPPMKFWPDSDSRMERCWLMPSSFSYPPPDMENVARGRSPGPISLRHIVPDIEGVDSPINATDILPFTHTEVSKTQRINFELSLPQIETSVLDSRTRRFDQLFSQTMDTYIFHHTRDYVETSMQNEDVSRYIKRS